MKTTSFEVAAALLEHHLEDFEKARLLGNLDLAAFSYHDILEIVGKVNRAPWRETLLDRFGEQVNHAGAVLEWWRRSQDPYYIERMTEKSGGGIIQNL